MIKYFFGLPRCGKTTLAVSLAIKYARKGIQVYCNFPIVNTDLIAKGKIKFINAEWLGKYDMSNSVILIDEASIYADNRDYKSFDAYRRHFLYLHGHYKCDIIFLAQGYNAVDKKIRDLTEELYWVYKSKLIPGISRYVRVPYGLGFTSKNSDSEYGEVNEGYKAPAIFSRIFAPIVIRRRWYKYFDSWEAPELPPILYNYNFKKEKKR